jgi:hypothetical protein
MRTPERTGTARLLHRAYRMNNVPRNMVSPVTDPLPAAPLARGVPEF